MNLRAAGLFYDPFWNIGSARPDVARDDEFYVLACGHDEMNFETSCGNGMSGAFHGLRHSKLV
jgi:hypothetical protein